MDGPVFKGKYQKYKYKVKLWEKQFKEKNGRVPSKHDIREAPTSIRESYKMYYKLKTSFLEEALSDALEDDSFDLSLLENSNSQSDSRLSSSFSDITTPDVSALTSETSIIYPKCSTDSLSLALENATNAERIVSQSPNNFGTNFEAEASISINQSAWGNGLDTKIISNEINGDIGIKLRKSMSDKLFRNSSYIKRNPRKSLSRNSFGSSQSSLSLVSNSQNEALPDLETLLSQKVQQLNEKEIIELPEHTVILANIKGDGATFASTLNQEWLNRCNAANSIESERNIVVIPNVSDKSVENPQTFGISNINANALANYEATAISKSMLSFDMCHLNLKPKITDIEPTKMGCNDDEIANSEEEMDQESRPQFRSIRSQKQNKRKRNEIDTPMNESKAKSTNDNEKIDGIISDEISKSNSKPAAISVSKRKSSVKPPVSKNTTEAPIETRRSMRSKTKPLNFKGNGTKGAISDSDNDTEEDPYADDDSVEDPNFSESETNCKKSETLKKSTDNDSVKKRQKSSKETLRKKVDRTKAIGKRKSTTINPIRRSRAKRTMKNISHDSSEEEPIQQDTQDNYVMEFGMETIKSVPRIPIDKLKQNTVELSKYICSEGTGDKPSAKSIISSHTGAKPMPLSTKNSIAKDKLEMKIVSGNLNENYVRLNLRKKVFVRGKKTFNFSRHKKKIWGEKKAAALSGPDMNMGGCDGGILTCFQCGLPGHFAQNCKVRSDRLLPSTADIDESPFPTLQEAEEMSKRKLLLTHTNREIPDVTNPIWKSSNEDAMKSTSSRKPAENSPKASNLSDNIPVSTEKLAYIGHKIPEEFLEKAGLNVNDSDNTNNIQPLYSLKSDGGVPDTPQEVFEALAMFGHNSFRNGQERAVMRILSGQSTLVTLSTGSGKSLCYQLPAYLYSKRKKCITLVISPLVSLMEDQVHGVPHFLNAQCLHTTLSEKKRLTTIQAIKSGEVDVLLVSPEAIVASENSTGFGSILRDLPPIAFVCIDEAHCVSQFGHNFRPSYLMVCRVLYEKLKVKTVLGLTATATLSTRQDIVDHLRIPDGLDGVISDIPLPDNLTLTVSCDENRDLALIKLLNEPKFTEFQSIIIYCSRRDECERVAKNLRTYFQDNISRELEMKNSSGKRKRILKTTIEPYHAGLPASKRRTIQNAFMRGDLKIVVATIAFGMGINKADIRSVIHYNMPMNFESYVQEVGRAGRDGLPSFCHLFLDSKNEDKVELRRHIYANSIDRFTIRKLLHKIFIPCACKRSNDSTTTKTSIESDLEAVQQLDWNDEFDSNNEPQKRTCPRHEVGFSVDETISELDLPEQNIATLLCYLELHDQRYIKTLSKAYISCKVFSYGGPSALKKAAQKCPPLAVAIGLDMQKGKCHESSTYIELPAIEIASAIGWNSGVVKYQLKQLEWNNENGLPKRSKISVEFSNLGFRVLAPGDLTATELDSTLNLLYSRVKQEENKQLAQLEQVFFGLSSVAVKSSIIAAGVESNYEKSENLKKLIRNYFQSNNQAKASEIVPEMPSDPAIDSLIISDIRTMIARYPENNFTGRSLARIFHGIQSPVFPAVIWGRCKHWRAHIKTDFNHIVNLANAEILKLRT